ncbi:MAG: hypothetical protein ABSF50_08170 [Burkholderiaceae bacterium]|jgi:hypothetical protein
MNLNRIARAVMIFLLAAGTIGITAGCVVVPEGGHYYHHDHYWDR